jgi:hypothetical protein
VNLDHWTPGHRPTRVVELPTGVRITWSRPGMPDAYQALTLADFDRLRARRTMPPIEQPTEEDLL